MPGLYLCSTWLKVTIHFILKSRLKLDVISRNSFPLLSVLNILSCMEGHVSRKMLRVQKLKCDLQNNHFKWILGGLTFFSDIKIWSQGCQNWYFIVTSPAGSKEVAQASIWMRVVAMVEFVQRGLFIAGHCAGTELLKLKIEKKITTGRSMSFLIYEEKNWHNAETICKTSQ